MFDDLFTTNESEQDDMPKMTNEQFVLKTKELLSKIENTYSECWSSSEITEEEYETSNCDNCNGDCIIKRGNKELNCYPDRMDGGCFVREFDNELFVDGMELILFENESELFYDLIRAEIINEAT